MTLEEVKRVCKKVAEQLHVIFDTQDYTEYGWTSVSLETDKFGGICVNLCYKHDSGRCFANIHSEREIEFTSAQQLALYANTQVQYEKSVRDFDGLYNFINSQY